jgi:hypothetical protein
MKKFIHALSNNPLLIIGFGLVFFIAYSELKAHTEEVKISVEKSKRTESVSFVNGRYRVDTSFIRNDLNKAKLISELEKQKLEEKRTVQEVPSFIWRFLDSISYDKKFEIVNPGEDWKEGITDYGHIVFKKRYDPDLKDSVPFISGDGAVLPNKRLIYFGMSDNIALMSFLHGGFGPHTNIIIFKHKNGKITDLWFGGMLDGDNLQSKPAIIRSLKVKRQNGC